MTSVPNQLHFKANVHHLTSVDKSKRWCWYSQFFFMHLCKVCQLLPNVAHFGRLIIRSTPLMKVNEVDNET